MPRDATTTVVVACFLERHNRPATSAAVIAAVKRAYRGRRVVPDWRIRRVLRWPRFVLTDDGWQWSGRWTYPGRKQCTRCHTRHDEFARCPVCECPEFELVDVEEAEQ